MTDATVVTMGRRGGPRGVTVAELLVAIAIILGLAGLLLPVFATARRAVWATGCCGNLHAIAQGIRLYTADHASRLPPPCLSFAIPGGFSAPDQQYPWTWYDAILPYVEAEQVFYCPADPRGPGYAMENGAAGQRTDRRGCGAKLLVLEYGFPGDGTVVRTTGWVYWLMCRYDREGNTAIALRHRNRANVLFTAGHVRALRLSEILDRELWWAPSG